MPRQKNPNGLGSYTKLKDGRVKWKQMKDGEERQITAKTPKELQEKINKIADLPIIKGKITVTQWFEQWLEVYILPLKKTATYNQYKDLWEQHIKPEIGKRPIKSIEKYDIQQVIAKMNKKTKLIRKKNKETKEWEFIDTGKGLSSWTMKHTRKVMSIAFKAAFEDKKIAINPIQPKSIEVPKKQAKPRKTIKTDELKILFEYAKKTRWYWAMRFLLVTGLRRGELLALKWSDIDFQNKQIVIDESNSSEGIGDTKSAELHYVPLSDRAIMYLNKQKEMLINETNPILYNEKLKKLDLIFPSETGNLLKPDSFNSALDRINEKANIHITPHMFRHTFVYMSKGIMTVSEIQEILGHDESTTTLDIYGTMLSDSTKMANKIDQAFEELENEIDKIEVKKEAKVIQLFQHKKPV